MVKIKTLSGVLLAIALSALAMVNVFADVTIQNGETVTLSANETLDMEGGSIIEAGGLLNALAGGVNTFVSGDWSNSGTFTAGNSRVSFTAGTGPSQILGTTTFYDLFCNAASKQLDFEAGSTQTINHTLSLNGQDSSTRIRLRSLNPGTRFTFDVTGGHQSVQYVDVQDSNALSNSITATGFTNSGNNDDTEPPPHWIFGASVFITFPNDGKTVGRNPTIIGTTGADEPVSIWAKVNGSLTQVAAVTADANGNFRIEQSDFTSSLDTGANTLSPRVGVEWGSDVDITVKQSPSADEVPIISSPAYGATLTGNKPQITGKGKANSAVTLNARDANGNLLLSNIATTTTTAAGKYTIAGPDYTASLPKGTDYLCVIVDGVASNILSVSLVDPYGIVYDSQSTNPVGGTLVTIQRTLDGGVTWFNAAPGTDIAATDVNPQTTGVDGAYAFLCFNGDFRLIVSKNGYTFPSIVIPMGLPHTGSHGELFTVAGAVLNIDIPTDFTGQALLKVEKDVNKSQASIGDILTYSVTIKNEGSTDVTDVYLIDKLSAGLKYIKGKVILDGRVISDPDGERIKRFSIGTVEAGRTRILKYQVIVGSGVTFGKYENSAHCEFSNGRVISGTAKETVKIIPDTLFDLGNIIGKVFHDRNANGIQDPPQNINGKVIVEEPIPNVQIVTEDGTLITTDAEGKYHLAAIIPGRHLVRLNERSLPEDAYLTTHKGVVVDITPGILAKVNFGVKLKEGINTTPPPFTISQDKDRPQPRLNVAAFKEEIILKNRDLREPVEFRIFTNYHLFIREWRLEIIDKDNKSTVKSFQGTQDNINEPIIWDGKNEKGKLIEKDRNYAYRLTVTGNDSKQDVTNERRLIVASADKIAIGAEKTEKEIEKEKQRWLEKESKVSNLDKHSIRIAGETIKILNPKAKIQNIRILRSGNLEAEIPVVQSKGLGARGLLENFQLEEKSKNEQIADIIIPKGEYDIEIIPKKPQDRAHQMEEEIEKIETGEALFETQQPFTGTYAKHIKVSEDYLLLVAMGDVMMGYTLTSGNMEPVQPDDKFKDGFWSEGRLAYYLKGKIKGKYLITSSLDTQREKKELFRNLDPDKYYPVYGDASSINYSATDTMGKLYLLVEWDKSQALWGNYRTAFTDTEFIKFNRTLYGGKVYYESVSTNQFGEPQTKLVVFKAEIKQKASHNELIGTGGSLFYLKDKYIIEGSDKVKIETRDKITGLVLATKGMEEGVDYDIDYYNGRIIFWQPVSQIAESASIISSNLLDGNPVYVVVDYEYEVKDKYAQGSYGGRIQQSLTDYLTLGSTYVKEEQSDNNYELKGADTIVHLGKNIKLIGEYAESESGGTNSFISTDGGLSFTELPTDDLGKGRAYGLKGEAYLLDNLGLTGYYKKIDKGFSSTSTVSQQGKELIGVGATLDLTSRTRLKAAYDIQKLIGDGNLQTQLQVGAQKTETGTAQIIHEAEKLRLTGEYRHQEVSGKIEQFESETNSNANIVALKADYKATENLTVSLERQVTLKGSRNRQSSVGVTNQVSKHLQIRTKKIFGTQGNATNLGVTANLKDKLELTGDYTKADDKTDALGDTASLSGALKADDKTEFRATFAQTDSLKDGTTQSAVFGSKRKIKDGLELTTDRTFAKNRDKFTQANTYGLIKGKDSGEIKGTLTIQNSRSNAEVSNTNIFGLSGDINDKLAALANFEKGIVQDYNGIRSKRNAGAFGLSYIEKDKFKASSKLELRLDNGSQDKLQELIYTTAEGKINPNTTVFGKANISQTKNTTTDSTEAQYKELAIGVAYRPVNFDRLNLLGKYTYLEDDSPSGQNDFKDIQKEKSHIIACEAVYDLTNKWQLAEKLAYKMGEEKVSGFGFTRAQTWLMINRLNYKIDKDWQISLELRRLTQKQAKDSKQGALIEITRNIGQILNVGLGYNFTDFNDDLTHLDYTSQGPFIRITGEFYDRSPAEIAAAQQKRQARLAKIGNTKQEETLLKLKKRDQKDRIAAMLRALKEAWKQELELQRQIKPENNSQGERIAAMLHALKQAWNAELERQLQLK